MDGCGRSPVSHRRPELLRCALMGQGVKRRDLLAGGLALGVIAAIEPALRAQDDTAAARPKPGDLLVRDGDDSKTPLTPGDVSEAKPTVAWALEPASRVVRNASRFNRLTIVRAGAGDEAV